MGPALQGSVVSGRSEAFDHRGGSATPLETLKPTPYEQHRGYVLAVLARRCRWIDDGEREALFHDAYALMLEKQRAGSLEPEAMHPNQLRAYLTQTAINKALDEGRRAERKRTEPIGDRALAEPDVGTGPEEAAATSLENATVREIVAELPARRQTVVKLRFFFERSPEEIQRMLAISSRTYRRELERGLRHICERYELVRAGTFCDSRRSLILAYVAGSAGARDAAEAREHLANCPGCARWAAGLREATRQVAAVVPLVAFADGVPGRLAEATATVHHAVAQLVTGAKQQATAMIAHLDPGAAGYATAARPGTLAAVVAGCIAVGGGATYCAVEGVSAPVEALVSRIGGANTNEAAKRGPAQPAAPKPAPPQYIPPEQPPPQPVMAEPAPAPPSPPDPPPREAQAKPAPRPEPQPTTPEPAPAPPPVVTEFGAEGSAVPVPVEPPDTASPATASRPSGSESGSGSDSGSQPPPPGEFDP